MTHSPSSPTLRQIAIGQVLVNPRNRGERFTGNDEDSALIESIRSNGLRQPIIVVAQKDGTFMLSHGERRWRACMALGHAIIDAVVHHHHALHEEDAIIAENVARKNLSTWETVTALRDRVIAHRRRAEVAGQERPSVAEVGAKLGLHARNAQQLWSAYDHLDQDTIQTIADSPVLYRHCSVRDLKHLGSLHVAKRPEHLLELTFRYGSTSTPEQARRDWKRSSWPKYRFKADADATWARSGGVFIPDSECPRECQNSARVNLSVHIHPSVLYLGQEQRDRVIDHVEATIARILADARLGLSAPDNDSDAVEGPMPEPDLVIVPTRTFENLCEIGTSDDD